MIELPKQEMFYDWSAENERLHADYLTKCQYLKLLVYLDRLEQA